VSDKELREVPGIDTSRSPQTARYRLCDLAGSGLGNRASRDLRSGWAFALGVPHRLISPAASNPPFGPVAASDNEYERWKR